MAADDETPTPPPDPSVDVTTPTTGGVTGPIGPKPKPLESLIASARRITSKNMTQRRGSKGESWQEDAWEMYDLVGEERFLATTLANRMGQAKFYVGEVGDDALDTPEPTDDEALSGILDSIGDGSAGLAQMVTRLGVNLFVAGDGWLAGIPKDLIDPEADMAIPTRDRRNPALGSTARQRVAIQEIEPLSLDDVSLDDLEWRMLSVSEVKAQGADEVVLMLGEDQADQITVNPDDIFLIRCWRPHPRKSWEAESPTRSSLPVLRELVGLTMHISAQVDSRLAGAGLLIVPQSAQRALKQALNIPEDDDTDPFTDALIEAMLTPISDRSAASALVPLVVTVPDEVTDAFNFITFAKPLDTEAKTLRDEAIRRLALGQDAPPELLLGVGGMNHWGAWLVREDVVTTHIEPPLALICDALTTQFLWPVLEQMGYPPERAQQFVIWYDVSHMIMRPNRAADAQNLYDRGVLSDATLREANGFSEQDAPAVNEAPAVTSDPAVEMALAMVTSNPTLFTSPGLPAVVEQIKAVLNRDTEVAAPVASLPAAPTTDEEPNTSPGTDGGEPAEQPTDSSPAEPTDEGIAASGLVHDPHLYYPPHLIKGRHPVASTSGGR